MTPARLWATLRAVTTPQSDIRPPNENSEQPNGVGLWGLGSRWNAERHQAADFSAAQKEPSVIRC